MVGYHGIYHGIGGGNRGLTNVAVFDLRIQGSNTCHTQAAGEWIVSYVQVQKDTALPKATRDIQRYIRGPRHA